MNKKMAVGVILLMLGLIALALIATEIYGVLFNRVNIEDKTYYSFEEGELGECELKYVLGKTGELKVRKTVFGIPLLNADASLYAIVDNGGYVFLQVDKDRDKFDSLMAQTDSYKSGTGTASESVSFLGKAVEMTDEQMALVTEYFAEKGVSTEVWMNNTSLYVLVQTDTVLLIIQCCISGGMMLIGIILLIRSRRDRFGETVYVGEEPPALAEAPAEAETPAEGNEE